MSDLGSNGAKSSLDLLRDCFGLSESKRPGREPLIDPANDPSRDREGVKCASPCSSTSLPGILLPLLALYVWYPLYRVATWVFFGYM